MKQSNGHIKIYSEIGHGATINLYLPPLYGVTGAAKPAASDEAALPAGREVVLLVENDERVLSLTGKMLSDLGYGVLQARNGAEALDRLAAHPSVALLFIDVVMPGITAPNLPRRRCGGGPTLRSCSRRATRATLWCITVFLIRP